MAFWIFKCNPNRYRLADRLADRQDSLTWTVAQHKNEIGPGDTAFLWVTGPERGIRAVLRIDDAPRVRPELESEQRYWVDRDTECDCALLVPLLTGMSICRTINYAMCVVWGIFPFFMASNKLRTFP